MYKCKGNDNVLLAVCLTTFVTNLTSNSVNISLPAIGQELSSPAFLLSWVPTAYFIISGALLLPMGRLGDFISRKRTNIIGMVIFALGAVTGVLGSNTAFLILARSIQGTGVAMIFGTGLAILTSAYPVASRGKVLGIYTAVGGIGISIGPVIGGLLTHYLGWRYVFAVSLVITLLALLVTWNTQISSIRTDEEHYDVPGALLYIGGLFLALTGLGTLKSLVIAKWMLAAGLLVLVLFIRYELSKEEALLNIKLLVRNSTFSRALLASFIVFATFGSLLFVFPVYLQAVHGFSAQNSGFIMLSLPVMMAITSPLAGKLADRVNPRLIAAVGNVIMGLTLVAGLLLNGHTASLLIFIALALMGLGFGLFASPNNYCVVTSVNEEQYGTATSTLNTMQMVGQAFGMSVVSLVISLVMGVSIINTATSKLFISCIHTVVLIGALLMGAAAIISLSLGSIHQTGYKKINKMT